MREIKGEELGDISTYGINAKEERVIVVKGAWERNKEGGRGEEVRCQMESSGILQR